MDEKQFQQALFHTFTGFRFDIDQDVKRVQTFEEVGMLTRDHGLVVTMNDGSEFQLTITQSRETRG